MSRRVGMEGRSSWFCRVGERRTLLGSLRGERRVGRGLVGRVVGYGSLACIGLIALGLVFPVVGNGSTSALSCLDGDTTSCAVGTAETEAEVKVKTSIAVAMSSKVAMEVVPTSTGSSTIGSTSLSVSTNSVDGYALYMQASDGLTNTSTVHDGMVDVEKISIINTPTNLSTMPNNRYGYYLGEEVASLETTFAVLPTTNSVIKRTTSMTSGAADASYGYGDTYNLSFGVKVGTELPAGTYSGAVTVSAVANPETVRSMSDLNYMQDMTSDICSRTREGYTKRLIDTRDGKSYWVAKLKDGNCWMVQNLALDLGAGSDPNLKYVAKLTPQDSDVTEEWSPAKSTNAVIINGSPLPDPETNINLSWNFGLMVLSTPITGRVCGTYQQNWDQTLAEHCLYIVDVSDGWTPTYSAQPGDYKDYTNTLVAIQESNKTYDAHYLLGNYYQYSTATAGTGTDTTKNANAPSSICPKGWQLPAVETNDTYKPISTPGRASFYDLLLAYGYPSTSNWWHTSDTRYSGTSIINRESPTSIQNIANPPISLVRAGQVQLGGTANIVMYNMGDRMYYRGSTTGVALHIDPSTIMPFPFSNDYAFSVRCVAHQ